MTLYETVMKLIGPVQPVGETNEDARRLENLKNLIALVDTLLGDIDRVIPCKRRVEHSMKIAGKTADEFFTSLGITDE